MVSACMSCRDLGEVLEIKSPAQLARAIRVVRGRVADGTLVEVAQSSGAPDAFVSLQEHAPWPDYIEHTFRCARCGQRFRLTVETYHGVGGKWECQGQRAAAELRR
jgi:hypothetical protein